MAEPARVALLVTCLVDLFRPSVGFAAVKLLEQAGCTVDVPRAQTCCGQPAYNSGDRADAKAIARQIIAAFAGYDYVVVPSGSCAGMVKVHYPELFADEPATLAQAQELASRTHELVSFLVDIRGMGRVTARWPRNATYHDGCSGLRELGIKQQPRRLLASVDGLTLTELPGAEVCCGFGGTFCIKYPEISDKMVTDKAADIAATGADAVLAGDLGCLLNIAGKLSRRGSNVEVRHVAEVLADMTADVPPIGPPSRTSHAADQPQPSGESTGRSRRPNPAAGARPCPYRLPAAPSRGDRAPAGIRGIARGGPRDQGPCAGISRFLPRALRAKRRRLGRPSTLDAQCRRGARRDPRYLPGRECQDRHQGQIDGRRGDRPQRASRSERHHAGRNRSRRIHHPAAPRASEPHHRAGDPSDEGAGRRCLSRRPYRARPGAPAHRPARLVRRGAHGVAAALPGRRCRHYRR